jgi:hypothetical protein
MSPSVGWHRDKGSDRDDVRPHVHQRRRSTLHLVVLGRHKHSDKHARYKGQERTAAVSENPSPSTSGLSLERKIVDPDRQEYYPPNPDLPWSSSFPPPATFLFTFRPLLAYGSGSSSIDGLPRPFTRLVNCAIFAIRRAKQPIGRDSLTAKSWPSSIPCAFSAFFRPTRRSPTC